MEQPHCSAAFEIIGSRRIGQHFHPSGKGQPAAGEQTGCASQLFRAVIFCPVHADGSLAAVESSVVVNAGRIVAAPVVITLDPGLPSRMIDNQVILPLNRRSVRSSHRNGMVGVQQRELLARNLQDGE